MSGMDAFTRGLAQLGRAHHATGRRLDAGRTPEPDPEPLGTKAPSRRLRSRKPAQSPVLTSAMVTLAWALLERPDDPLVAVALARQILHATGDLP